MAKIKGMAMRIIYYADPKINAAIELKANIEKQLEILAERFCAARNLSLLDIESVTIEPDTEINASLKHRYRWRMNYRIIERARDRKGEAKPD